MNCSVSVMVMASTVDHVVVHGHECNGMSCLVVVADCAWVARDDHFSIRNIQNIVVIESQEHILCVSSS